MSDRDGLYRKWEREGEPPLVGPMTDREKGFHVVQGVFGPVFVPDGIVSGDERDSAMTDRQTVTVEGCFGMGPVEWRLVNDDPEWRQPDGEWHPIGAGIHHWMVRDLLTELIAERQRREQAEMVVDATDLITDVMCADSRIPDWHRNRLQEIVDTRNAYHAQKEVDRADL